MTVSLKIVTATLIGAISLKAWLEWDDERISYYTSFNASTIIGEKRNEGRDGLGSKEDFFFFFKYEGP